MHFASLALIFLPTLFPLFPSHRSTAAMSGSPERRLALGIVPHMPSSSVDKCLRDIMIRIIHQDKFEGAKESAVQIDDACAEYPGDDPNKADEETEHFLWALWNKIIAVMRKVPHSHPAQARMVSVLIKLHSLDSFECFVWGVSSFSLSIDQTLTIVGQGRSVERFPAADGVHAIQLSW